jgi:hypothetical protein
MVRKDVNPPIDQFLKKKKKKKLQDIPFIIIYFVFVPAHRYVAIIIIIIK